MLAFFHSRPQRAVIAALTVLLAGSCASTADMPVSPGAGLGARGDDAEQRPLLQRVNRLYGAFCFDGGEEADWDAMRDLFAEGATFASPIAPGSSHRGVDEETFIAEFRQFIRTSPLGATGYHERVTHVALDIYGLIAHTWVTFDAFVPGQEPDRRGVDSIQWVRDGDGWKLMSFTTQYESDGLPLPSRFAP